MNLVLLFKEDFVERKDHVRIMDRRYEHIRNIHRASVGDDLRVGLCNGRLGTGSITAIDDHKLEMDIRLDCAAPKSLPVTLVLALPRPNMIKRILSSVTAMGVKRIILFHSKRVEKSFWKSPVLKEENINKQLILGLEQACDTILPTVELRHHFKPFIEDELPAIANDSLKLVAHPEVQESCPRQVNRPVTLVIGPEGGFIPYEIDKLIDIRFTPVHLGGRILKVESVIPAVLSKLF